MNTEETNVTHHTFTGDAGQAQAAVYRLFPGVEVTFLSVCMADFDLGAPEPEPHSVTIHYCREGRAEREHSGEFFCLMPGRCSVSLRDSAPGSFRLPLGHYRGIRIRIRTDLPEDPLAVYAGCCGCSPLRALEDLCDGMSHRVLQSSVAVRSFFEALYEADPVRRPEHLRSKLPELFYLLKYAETGSPGRPSVPRSRVETVRAVSDHITRNLDGKITLEQLTAAFGVSDTYLQNAFRSVYGMPVSRFIRVQKMQRAAQVLIRTDRTVAQIAEEFGYENESKFSAAFRRIMGSPPGAYRREHTKIAIL